MLNKLKPKSEFSRNVLTLMTGTTIAQAIPIAISPILTRMYSPEDFGLLALYMSFLMIFSNLVAGKYELSILIPKRDRDAKDIVVFSMIISALVSCFLLILSIVFHEKIVFMLGNNKISFWLYILPINIFILSSVSIMYYWHNRKKQYRKLSNNQILQSSSQGSINLIIAIFTKLNGALIIGTIVGGIVSFSYMYKNTKYDFKNFQINKKRYFVLMKEYIKFPKYMLPSGLLENISAQLPIFFLGSFFGTNVVGFYSLSQRIVRIPIMLIGSSIGNVFRQQASKDLVEYGNCRGIFKRTLQKLLLISTIPFFIFYYAAPYLFSFIFGEEWEIAGEYAKILTPLFYLQFIVSPLSNMFMIAQKQQYDLYMQIYLIFSVSISFFIGYNYFNDIVISLYLFTMVYSFKYIYELIMSYRFTIR